MVLWLSSILLHQLTSDKIIQYVVSAGQVKNPKDIKGAIFDNMEDVELFVDRLEKKYIIHVLKQ
jgi:hypothetical protein